MLASRFSRSHRGRFVPAYYGILFIQEIKIMTLIDEDIPMHHRGNGRPVTGEQTLTDLKVKGSIPAELDGRYVRAGANPKTGTSPHPFMGDGMMHGVRLRDGKAEWYRNRYVQTPFIKNPELDAYDLSVMLDLKSSKANTHVIGHAGQILALEEAHYPYLMDAELNTIGPIDYDGVLNGPFTAHPKICGANGELIGFGASAVEPHLRYYRISPDGKMLQNEDITIGGPVMMHDFNITENYTIFMDMPACIDLELAMAGDMPVRWDESYPTRLGVMPRNGTDADVKWFDINPCYVFHSMNAYEDGSNIIVDVVRYDYVWRDSAIDFPPSALWRWTIDIAGGKVKEEQIDDKAIEFPRIAENLVGQKHRFGYTMTANDAAFAGETAAARGGIRKYDMETKSFADIDFGQGRLGGEPVFAAAADGENEDDGYLMTYVYDADTNASELVIMDAASMDSSPVATVELPRIPGGFHGSWIPASMVD
jgi:carotenoid cleavage dioxygenase-like enzyme